MLRFLFLFLFLCTTPAAAADLKGQWQGTLPTGTPPLRVVVWVSPDQASPPCTLTIIDRTGDLPCEQWSVKAGTIHFYIRRFDMTFDGHLGRNGRTIEGVWSQKGFELPDRPLVLTRASRGDAWATDLSPHKISFLTTSDHVRLEWLDWGGSGAPIVLIPGFGETAHTYDAFAAKLRSEHHVYALTRRGFFPSDAPDPSRAAYDATRLGDDVLEAMTAAKIDRAILAGWSLGGEEVSSVATRHPERVIAAIYLDGAYAYSFYAPGNRAPSGLNLTLETNDLVSKINRANAGSASGPQATALLDDILTTDLPRLQQSLREARDFRADLGPAPKDFEATVRTHNVPIENAIWQGVQKFGPLNVPTLAIFAVKPPGPASGAPTQGNSGDAAAQATRELIERYRAGNPNARVVEINNARHDVFNSNPDEVVAEVRKFLLSVPR